MEMRSLYSELIEDGNPRLFSPSPSRESEIIRRSLSILTPSLAPSEISDNGDGPSGGDQAGEMGSSRDTMQTSSSYETLPSYHSRVSGPRRSSSRFFSYIPLNRRLPPLPQQSLSRALVCFVSEPDRQQFDSIIRRSFYTSDIGSDFGTAVLQHLSLNAAAFPSQPFADIPYSSIAVASACFAKRWAIEERWMSLAGTMLHIG
ncbi:hypothetical protein F5879DRAFT_1063358 [Lentinula edodes]|nr:hypothetical protein F5879DRAFT_1063358 [Lentinula edodes]